MVDEPQTARELLPDARALFEAGDFRAALVLLRSAPFCKDRAVGALLRDCLLNLGEVSEAFGEVTRLRCTTGDDEGLRRQARFMLGRLRETDPTWLPPVDAPASPPPAKPGKVLHLLKESLPYSQTGYTFRSRMTLEAQRRAGWEPVVVTSLGFPSYAGHRTPDESEAVDDIRHYRLDPPYDRQLPLKKTSFDIVLTEQAARTLAIALVERPAVVQAGSGFRGYDQALVGLAVARALDVPFVYEVRGFLEATWSSRTDLQEQGEYYRRRRAQDERLMAEADVVLTIADSMRDVLVERGVEADKVHVVPNAVDVERFAPRPKDPHLRDELGLGDRFVVGYISNLGKREGLEHLLRATAELRAEGHDVACLIVGDGPERPHLERLAGDLDLAGAAVLTGHVPNDRIEAYYALIDVFVVPRIDDQAARLVTPLKPLEAMAMKRTVVASDLPALRELVEPDVRGLLTPPSDDLALTEALARLIDAPDLRRELAEAGYAWVRHDRTLDANVARYRDALGHLVG